MIEFARAVDGHVMIERGGWFWQSGDAEVIATIAGLDRPEHIAQRFALVEALSTARKQRPSICEHLPAFKTDGAGGSPL